MPRKTTPLPRIKPAPKEKPMTKWEKFRKEKGIPTRKKRSALVYEETTGEWAPRWGPKSAKKILEKNEWLIEETGDGDGGKDPFTVKKDLKKMSLAKEKMKQLRNQMDAAGIPAQRHAPKS